MISLFKKIYASYSFELTQCLKKIDLVKLKQIVEVLFDAYKLQKHIFVLGNGGSSTTALHMAADLGKGTLSNVYSEIEPRLRVRALTDNIASITAFANDLSYDHIFSEQLNGWLHKDDVIIVLSASGNSPNIIKAIRLAKKIGAKTIGFLGFKNGGKTAKLVDYALIVDSRNYGICEDIHLILNHVIITEIIELKSLKYHAK